jgi:hypothetical protein
VEPALWESNKLPPSLSGAARDVLKLLLEPLPDCRLGNSPDDFERLMVRFCDGCSGRVLRSHSLLPPQSHAWFHGLDWDLLAQKKLTPPWIPGPHCLSIKSSHYSNMPLYEQVTDPRFEDIELTLSDQTAYADVEYCCEQGVRREVIANITGRNHHTSTTNCSWPWSVGRSRDGCWCAVLQSLYRVKSVDSSDAVRVESRRSSAPTVPSKPSSVDRKLSAAKQPSTTAADPTTTQTKQCVLM